MKLKRNGRDYEYDYLTIVVKGEYHRALKSLSEKENIPMGKLIKKLVEHYESSIG
jgi:hypothetical protein